MKKYISLLILLAFTLYGFGQSSGTTKMWNARVGNNLYVGDTCDLHGKILFESGSPGVGKVWTSDASGYGSWITPAGVDSGVVGSPTISVSNALPKVVSIPSSVALPGSPTTTTQSSGTNNTTVATTAFVKAQGYATVGDSGVAGNADISFTAAKPRVASLKSTVVKSVVLNTTGVLYTTPVTFTTSGNTATGSLALATQSANTGLFGPSSGGAATPTFRALVASDVSGAVDHQRVGTIFNDIFSTSANYTSTLSSGTQTFGSNVVTMAGGNATYTANLLTYIYSNAPSGTLLEDCQINSVFNVTTNSTGAFGYGVGLSSIGANGCIVDMNNNATTNRGQLRIVDPLSGTVYATSSTNLTYTNTTDYIQLEIRFVKHFIVVITAKVWTGSTIDANGHVLGGVISSQTTFTYNSNPNNTPTYRFGQISMYNGGGTQNVYSLNFATDIEQNPWFVLCGDSRTTGAGVSVNDYRSSTIVLNASGKRGNVWAQGGAQINDLFNSFNELKSIIKTQNCYFILQIGVNDLRVGRTVAQFKTDIIALCNLIQTTGGIPILVKIAPVTAAYAATQPNTGMNTDIATINTWIGTQSYLQYDEATLISSGGVLSASYSYDGIHINSNGQSVSAANLINTLNTVIQFRDMPYALDQGAYGKLVQADYSGEIYNLIWNRHTGTSASASQELIAGTNTLFLRQYNASASSPHTNAAEVVCSSAQMNFITAGTSGSFSLLNGTGGGSNLLLIQPGEIDIYGQTTGTAAYQRTVQISESAAAYWWTWGLNNSDATKAGKTAIVNTANGLYLASKIGIQFGCNEAGAGAPGTATVANFNSSGRLYLGGNTSATYQLDVSGDVGLATAGKKFRYKTGSNACAGTGTLVGGTATISTTAYATGDFVLIQDTGGGVVANIGALYISATSTGVSFTVSSSNALDTSTFSWVIVGAY